jgi:GAF domain-containing protein
LLDAKKKRLVFRAAVGDGAQGILGQEVPLKGSRHGLAFATGEVQNNTPTYASIEKKAQVKFRNVLVAPLLVNGEAVGTISAVNKQGADHFSAQDMEAYRLFADLAAVVVRQRCREEVLRRGVEGGAGDELPATLGAEDRELLAVFGGIARVRKRHPERLAAIGQVVEAMGK